MLTRKYAESEEQIAFFKLLCGVPYRGLTLREFFYAVPNAGTRGGRRAMLQAMRRVQEGLSKGVPDVECPVAVAPFTGLHIEFKRKDGKPSDTSKEQREWIARLRELGRKVEVAYGCEDAWRIAAEYLGIRHSGKSSKP